MHRRPSTNITRFTSISANGFYTLTRTGLLNTADSDAAADSIPCEELRVLAADEKAMAELYAQTELLQTATQPKRLVVYKEYLLWFRDLQADEPRVPDPSSSHQKGSNAAEALTACSTSKVGSPKRLSAVLEGYANIRGMYVESNHSTKIHASGEIGSYSFGFQAELKQLAFEYVYLDNERAYSRWRGYLSNCPVWFRDYSKRYEKVMEITNDNAQKVCLLRELSTSKLLICKSKRVHSSDGEGAKIRGDFVREASVQICLKHSQIVAEFCELQFDGESYHLIEAEAEGYRLSDWFDSYWVPEKFDKSVGRKITLGVLRSLSQLVDHMHQQGLTHGGFKRDNILVNHTTTTSGVYTTSNQAISSVSEKRSRVSNHSQMKPNYQKAVFLLGSLSNSQFHPRCPDWGSIMCVQEYPELYIDKGVQTFWCASAEDILGLGILFFEIVYGICIPKVLNHRETWETEFVSNLMERPHKHITQRSQLHYVGQEIAMLIASMLNPDWKKRPLIIEVVQTLQSLLVEATQTKTIHSIKHRPYTNFQSLGRSQ